MIKNKFILKGISLFLSFWMLMVSTGFSVNYHLCEGEIVNWSFINDADLCDHEQEEKSCCESGVAESCHMSTNQKVEKPDCCNSDQDSMELETEFNLSNSKIEFALTHFILLSQYFFAVSSENEQQISYNEYEVPLLKYRQEAPFIQSFLI